MPDKTYGQTDARTDGRTDRPCFIGLFRPRSGVQKYNVRPKRIILLFPEIRETKKNLHPGDRKKIFYQFN